MIEFLLTPSVSQKLIPVLIGQLLPPAIDLVNRYAADRRVRYLVSLLICILVGVALNIGLLNFDNTGSTVESILLINTSAKAAYEMYYKNSTVHHRLRNLN